MYTSVTENSPSISFICERIYRCWQLHSFCYAPDYTLQYSTLYEYLPDTASFLSEKCMERFYDGCSSHELPLILEEKENISFCGFLDHKHQLYLLGPFTSHFISLIDSRRYARSHNISQKDFFIPLLSLDQTLSALSLSCLLLTGCQYTEQELLEGNLSGNIDFPKELTKYQMDNYMQERERQPYEEELLWMDHIRTGDSYNSMSEIYHANSIGVLAKTPFKQEEYLVLSGITLATRVMIQEGVPSHEAYNLSDIYCQKLSECKTIPEIYKIYMDADMQMKRLVQTYKKSGSTNRYVEKCKNYIGSHLHSKLTLAEIAAALDISPSWLSRSFSKSENMSVSQYIMKQKLIAAKNMLKYSPASIGEIAEWLCFNSQSHFGECFRKEYDMTPTQFRNTAGDFH